RRQPGCPSAAVDRSKDRLPRRRNRAKGFCRPAPGRLGPAPQPGRGIHTGGRGRPGGRVLVLCAVEVSVVLDGLVRQLGRVRAARRTQQRWALHVDYLSGGASLEVPGSSNAASGPLLTASTRARFSFAFS